LPFPKLKDIEIPLLAALNRLGGEARPRDVYPIVAASFPDLTPEEQEERLENYPSTRKWWNLVQWVRQRLVDVGEIDGSTRGVWRITSVGRSRLTDDTSSPPPAKKPGVVPVVIPPVVVDLRDLLNSNLNEVKIRLLAELKGLRRC
jgi:restriction system protein